ncbi:MAG: ribonuclease HII [Candidatus Woesearchaeota archaeon]
MQEDMTFIAGIDEAGRGPLIGPLVICVAAIREEQQESLRELGVKDSKLLSEKQREEILKFLEHKVRYELVMIQPAEIDEAVLSKTTNLNWLEADHGANLLNKLDVKLDGEISRVIIDCPSNNPKAYETYFKKRVDNDEMVFQVEHKADLNHLIVGAASIIAKVAREKELEKIKRKLKIDFGSGYPGDPKTKKFLEENHKKKEFQHLFRKSWATYTAVADKKNQSKLDGF